MGARGPRSANDLAFIRPEAELIPIDVDAMARQYGDSREALRALKRAERHGQSSPGRRRTALWNGFRSGTDRQIAMRPAG